ncbi:putative DNA repair protein Rad14 [Myriangium duriaei CBS 260.36]|uniref:DNA repair protein RAD14 n=1 Tax=Myriangium duriaei CBS 260.36 TaxID=1168546 RepID=A0A9P4JA62_9PEZI|nr:putative DNA repair protein Rad14 [Myriangium duriaei CBS 260.36]
MVRSERPTTPPRRTHPGSIPKSPITPEQVRRMEEARLKAKALRNQQLAAAAKDPPPNRTPSGFIAGDKRPHSALTSTRASAPNQRDARQTPAGSSAGGAPRDNDIQAAKKFQKYVEYDFSKMTDTKAGFLTQEDDPHNKALHRPDDPSKPGDMTLKEWEQRQLLRRMRDQKIGQFEPGISALDAQEKQKKCRECGSLEIDFKWAEALGTLVCNACKDKYPDKYSLLTKTEAKEDYLLTDPELRDTELLPHLERPNPHKSTWNNMMLYLRYQVEEYAFSEKKWGSAEALDAEFERRQNETKKRKEAKFKSKLADLKRRTRVDAYKRRKAGIEGGEFGDKIYTGKHEHEWGRAVENPETGIPIKTCIECGMEIEELEF